MGALHRLYDQQMGHLQLQMWKRVDVMRSFVDEAADHDEAGDILDGGFESRYFF